MKLQGGEVGRACSTDGLYLTVMCVQYIALEHLEATYKSCNLVSNICVHASPEAKQPIAIIFPHEDHLRLVLKQQPLPGVDADASLADLCHEGAVQQLVMKECNTTGKRNNFKSMEMLEAVILETEEWTPANGFLTAAQKLQRKQIGKRFEQEIKVRPCL